MHVRSGVVGALWLTHCMHACEVHACAGTADVPVARRSALPQNDTECSARTSRWPAVGAARQPPPIPTAAPRPARARLASCTRTPGGACMQECMRAPPRRPCGVSPAVVGAARQPLPSTHRGPSSRPRATGRRAHAYRVDGPTYPSGWCSFRSFGGLCLEVAGRVGGRCSERFPTKKHSTSAAYQRARCGTQRVAIRIGTLKEMSEESGVPRGAGGGRRGQKKTFSGFLERELADHGGARRRIVVVQTTRSRANDG